MIKELIIKCPYTGVDVNIAPFLYVLSSNEPPKELASHIEDFIDDTVTYAKELLENDAVGFGYRVSLLSELKKALRCMTPGKYDYEDLAKVYHN